MADSLQQRTHVMWYRCFYPSVLLWQSSAVKSTQWWIPWSVSMSWSGLRSHLQVLLDVFSVVSDAARGDAGFPHQLKADLPTQVVGDLPLLSDRHTNWARFQTGNWNLKRWPTLTFLFSSTWQKSSSRSDRYLSWEKIKLYLTEQSIVSVIHEMRC